MSTVELLLGSLVLFWAFAVLSTRLALRLAHRCGLLDYPDEHRAHATPVPLGGGLAIALVVGVGMAAAAALSDARYWPVIALAGFAVALVGLVDDRRPIARWPRLAVHVAACLVLMAALFGTDALVGPVRSRDVLAACALMGALVWLLNLYNFMDGIDGLAAVEAAFVSLALAGILAWDAHPAADLLVFCVAIAGGTLGFLVCNWAPARIFMGDAGSGFLGFVLGAAALIAYRQAGLTLWTPAILLALFASDATVTLLRRMVRGDAWREGHRLHAYQRLGGKWRSHRRVVLAVLTVDIVWLLPLAVLAARRPADAAVLGVVAYVPVVAIVWLAGAGRSDALPPSPDVAAGD